MMDDETRKKVFELSPKAFVDQLTPALNELTASLAVPIKVLHDAHYQTQVVAPLEPFVAQLRKMLDELSAPALVANLDPDKFNTAQATQFLQIQMLLQKTVADIAAKYFNEQFSDLISPQAQALAIFLHAQANQHASQDASNQLRQAADLLIVRSILSTQSDQSTLATLRRLAVHQYHRPVAAGAPAVRCYGCKICNGSWSNPDKEVHVLACFLAEPVQPAAVKA